MISKISGNFMSELKACEYLSLEDDKVSFLLEKHIAKKKYARNEIPKLFAKAALLVTKNQPLDNLEARFNLLLSDAKDEIRQLERVYSTLNLKNKKSALNMKKATILADFLLLKNGAINFELIPILKKELLSDEDPIRIQLGLNELQKNRSLQEKIKNLSAPDDEDTPSHELIRIANNIPRNLPVTNNHARKLLISSLLTNFRQGKQGTCFATPLIIASLYSNNKEHIEDLCSLIENSVIERESDGVIEEFPFLLRNNPLREFPDITLDAKCFASGVIPLWEIPSIAAVIRFLEIKDPDKILPKLFALPGTINIKTVLQKLTEVGREVESGFAKACFVYSSQVCHPLLSIYENAVSGMAESFSSSMLRSRMIQTIQNVVEEKLNNKNPFPLKSLIDRIGILYDTRVIIEEGGRLDGAEGAFVLYDRSNSKNWKRIDTKDKFTSFIQDILKIKNFQSSWVNTIEKNYDPNNPKNKPWTTFCGNNFDAVIKIYSSKRKQKETYKPKNALELLTHLVQSIQKLEGENKDELKNHPWRRTPARILSLHAFTLLEGHPSLIALWESKDEVTQTIKEKVIQPFHNLPHQKLSQDVCQKGVRLCFKYLSSVKQKNQLSMIMEKLSEEPTLYDFRNCLAFALYTLGILPKRADLLPKIDRLLINSLPLETRKQLIGSAIHIGDSNWQNNGNDLHLAFMVNPGNGQLELFLIDEERKKIIALNQKEWVNDATWEIYR